ncbi:MAG: hypothetical protein WCX48_04185 [Bacteroidales bacterium]
MKKNIKLIVLLFAAILFFGCKSDDSLPSVILSLKPDNVTGKSGQNISSTLNITSPNGVDKIVIYKTVNLVKDKQFGDVNITPTLVNGNDYIYNFNYKLSPDEVEKLVGFNFHVVDKKGEFAEKDLTVNTAMSGWQTIFTRKWKLTSRMWTSVNPAVEDKKDCENDDVYTWKQDGTYNISFGTSACTYDGFNVYDTWKLSDDEKTFTMTYHGIFDPSKITSDVYTVKLINSEKFIIWTTMDLSIFGLSDKEVFESTYEAVP